MLQSEPSDSDTKDPNREMGKLSVFNVVLMDDRPAYYEGQLIRGHLYIEARKPIKLQGITLTVAGRAYVHWSETKVVGSGNVQRQESIHFHNKEDYFHKTILMYGKASGSETTILPIGSHSLDFEFQIPTGLPSTFEGEFGYVRYLLKGTITRPWKQHYVTKTPVVVLRDLDLNLEPRASLPSEVQDEKTLCCWCCKTGPIAATLRLDRTGYVPGEAITLSAEVSNHSRRKIGSSGLTFDMQVAYHSNKKTKFVTHHLANLSYGGTESGMVDSWRDMRIPIPSVPPSHLIGCNIIDVKYTLSLRVDPSGPAFDLYLPVEVLIGSIPVSRGIPLPADTCLYSAYTLGKASIREQDDPADTRGTLEYTPVYHFYHTDDWNQH